MKIDQAFLQKLRILGAIEGVSTLLLFGVAMPLKYLADLPIAVSIVGPIHGALFMALVAMFLMGRRRVPIPTPLTVAGIACAIVPFGPFIFDRWLADLQN